MMLFAPSFFIACRRWLPFGVQYAIVLADQDERIEEAADLLDHRHQFLDVRLGRIALVGRRLDFVDRQRHDQHRRAAERIAIGAQDGAAIVLRRPRSDRGAILGSTFAVSATVSPIDPAAAFFRRGARFFAFAIRQGYQPASPSLGEAMQPSPRVGPSNRACRNEPWRPWPSGWRSSGRRRRSARPATTSWTNPR